MNIFDSDQFKNLQPFTEMQIQYVYVATTESGQLKNGFITAISLDQARQILASLGLNVTKLEEAAIGRDNPFTPYYQDIVPSEPS